MVDAVSPSLVLALAEPLSIFDPECLCADAAGRIPGRN